MSGEHHLRDLLHDATHRVPGVPAHVEHPAVHHGRALQNRPLQNRPLRSPALQDRVVQNTALQDRVPANRSVDHPHSLNHSPARQPRVLVGWQRRIALFFGRQL